MSPFVFFGSSFHFYPCAPLGRRFARVTFGFLEFPSQRECRCSFHRTLSPFLGEATRPIAASGFADEPFHSSNRAAIPGRTGESALTRRRIASHVVVVVIGRPRARARVSRCNFRPGRRVGLMSNFVPINFTLELILDLWASKRGDVPRVAWLSRPGAAD